MEQKHNEWKNFTDNMKLLRKSYDLTVSEMARKVNVSTGTIRKIEKGHVPPRLSVEILFRIEKCFGTCPADMMRPMKSNEDVIDRLQNLGK